MDCSRFDASYDKGSSTFWSPFFFLNDVAPSPDLVGMPLFLALLDLRRVLH